jgi:hypothetical protein
MAKWDNFVYSYVSRNAVDTILEEGLYGGKALLNRLDLLEVAAKGRGISTIKLKNKIEKGLDDSFSRPALLGPNIIFHLIPDIKMVSKKQPVRKHKLVPIKINLTKLLSDHPSTKIFGMELKPYKEGMSDTERHHYISAKELKKYLAMTPRELWESYNDIDDKGLYAPNVPHASIHTKSGIILPEYLQVVKRASTEETLRLIKMATVFSQTIKLL